MNRTTIILSLMAACMLAACTTEPTEGARSMPKTGDKSGADSGEIRVRPVPTLDEDFGNGSKEDGSEIVLGRGLQRLADLAKKDLSAKLGVEQNEIKTMQAEFVTWRDSSAGCPKPGNQYMQVLTNGSRITLSANKQLYHYHSGGKRPPFLCSKPSSVEPLPYEPGEA